MSPALGSISNAGGKVRTWTETPKKFDYSEISNLLPYQLGLLFHICLFINHRFHHTWPLNRRAMNRQWLKVIRPCTWTAALCETFDRHQILLRGVVRPSITLCHEVTLLSQPYGMCVHWLLILCLNHMGIRWALSSQCIKYITILSILYTRHMYLT